MQSPQAKLKEIRRILTLWPPQATDEGDELVRGFMLAVEDYPMEDVETAVTNFIKGNVPGIVSFSFRPKPPEVGAECRRVMNLRLDREHRHRKPALPPPDIERSPEAQARVRALVAQTVANLAAQSLDETPQERHRRVVAWANERIDAQRFTAGDPDADRDAA